VEHFHTGEIPVQFSLGPRAGQTMPISTASVNFLVVQEYPVNPVEKLERLTDSTNYIWNLNQLNKYFAA
jgi:hypothetical protein